MKTLRLAALLIVVPFFLATAAQAAPVVRTAPPFVDGYYSINGSDTTTTDVELNVGHDGKLIVGGVAKSGVSCSPSTTAEADAAELTLCFYFPRSIPISASRAFSYSGEVLTSTAQSGLSTVITGTATYECTVARHYRDSTTLEIGEGTSEVQKMLIARSLGV